MDDLSATHSTTFTVLDALHRAQITDETHPETRHLHWIAICIRSCNSQLIDQMYWAWCGFGE